MLKLASSAINDLPFSSLDDAVTRLQSSGESVAQRGVIEPRLFGGKAAPKKGKSNAQARPGRVASTCFLILSSSHLPPFLLLQLLYIPRLSTPGYRLTRSFGEPFILLGYSFLTLGARVVNGTRRRDNLGSLN